MHAVIVFGNGQTQMENVLSVAVILESNSAPGKYRASVNFTDYVDDEVYASASTNIIFNTGIGLKCPDWLGIDLTDPADKPHKSIMAEVKYNEGGTPDVTWTLDGVAIFDPDSDRGITATIVEQGNPGSGYLKDKVTATASPGGCSATNLFTVVKLDLTLKDMGEDTEESVGAMIPYNGDDDDDNKTEDAGQTGPVPQEDDLVELTIDLKPDGLPDDEIITIDAPEEVYIHRGHVFTFHIYG